MKRRGFTLIEIVVVIAIGVIILAIGYFALARGIDLARAKDSVKRIVETLHTARDIAKQNSPILDPLDLNGNTINVNGLPNSLNDENLSYMIVVKLIRYTSVNNGNVVEDMHGRVELVERIDYPFSENFSGDSSFRSVANLGNQGVGLRPGEAQFSGNLINFTPQVWALFSLNFGTQQVTVNLQGAQNIGSFGELVNALARNGLPLPSAIVIFKFRDGDFQDLPGYFIDTEGYFMPCYALTLTDVNGNLNNRGIAGFFIYPSFATTPNLNANDFMTSLNANDNICRFPEFSYHVEYQ